MADLFYLVYKSFPDDSHVGVLDPEPATLSVPKEFGGNLGNVAAHDTHTCKGTRITNPRLYKLNPSKQHKNSRYNYDD